MKIVCHRGACRLAPENTLASAAIALLRGGDILELDVRESADGVLYLMHDDTVDRTTDGRGAIAEMRAAEIDRLDAGSWFSPEFGGEGVPRLALFLKAFKEAAGFYIEVKAADPDRLGHAIRAAEVQDRCFTYSEDAEIRAALRDELPWLRRMVNWRDLGWIGEARIRERAAILEFHAPDFTEDRMALARAEGLEVMVYTDQPDSAMIARAHSAGVDYMNTDFPGLAARIREGRQ